MPTQVVVWLARSRDSHWMEALRERDFWFRYHAVDERVRLDIEYQFLLPWSDRYEFRLNAGPSDLTLSVVERTSGLDHVLGWWDDARWHPFALRWSELLMLVRTWRQRSNVLASPFPLLLLGRFVGFGSDDNEKHAEASRLFVDAYRSLGFSADDISQLVDHSLPVAEEKDYRWTTDAELGWVFGGEYACYSLRNRKHRDGDEGRFPFALVRELFSEMRD